MVRTKDPDYRRKVSKRRHRLHAYRRYPAFARSLANSNRKYNLQCDEIEKLEKEGRIFVIAPSRKVTVSRLERNMDKLGSLYWLGYNDALNQMEDLRKYLGRPGETG